MRSLRSLRLKIQQRELGSDFSGRFFGVVRILQIKARYSYSCAESGNVWAKGAGKEGMAMKMKRVIVIALVLIFIGCDKKEDENRQELQQTLAEKDHEVESLKSDLENLREKFDELGSKNKEMNKSIERQNRDLEKKHEQLTMKNKELEMTQRELESKNEDLKVKRGELESKNDELEKRRKELESKNEELEAKRKDLETTKGQNNKLVWMIPLLVSVALAVGTLMGLKVRGDVRKASAKAAQDDNGPWGYDR